MNYEFFIAKRIAKEKQSKTGQTMIKIAITSIALGIAMMLIATATGVGLQKKIKEKIAVFKGHIQIIPFGNAENQLLKPAEKNKILYEQIQKIPNVKKIQAFALKPCIIRTEKNFEGIVFKGVDSEYGWKGFKEYLIKGHFLNLKNKMSKEVLISEILSKRLHLKIGDTFDTYFLKSSKTKTPNRRIFKIIGIYNTGFEEFDKMYLLGDLRQIQRLNKWQSNQVGGFEVFVNDIKNVRKINQKIYKTIPTSLDSRSLFSIHSTIFQWLKMFDANIILIIVIMVIVASINMITSLLVMILERTSTIGILKTLGSRNWSIRKIFLYRASYIVIKGLFWGNLIAIILFILQKYFHIIQLDPNVYYVKNAPIFISFWQVLFLNIGTLVVCILALVVPSYIITKISPVKAITFS